MLLLRIGSFLLRCMLKKGKGRWKIENILKMCGLVIIERLIRVGLAVAYVSAGGRREIWSMTAHRMKVDLRHADRKIIVGKIGKKAKGFGIS